MEAYYVISAPQSMEAFAPAQVAARSPARAWHSALSSWSSTGSGKFKPMTPRRKCFRPPSWPARPCPWFSLSFHRIELEAEVVVPCRRQMQLSVLQ